MDTNLLTNLNVNWPSSYMGYSQSSVPTINQPTILEIVAYGLKKSDIEIKEINNELQIKSKSTRKTNANINKVYKLSNVVFKEAYLELGVLFIEFVDSENVKRHEIL